MKYLLIAACAAFIGILPLPIDAYHIIRLVVCGTCIFAAYEYTKISNHNKGINILILVVALIYNPIIPFYLSRDLWIAIDIIAGVFLIWLSLIPKSSLEKPHAIEDLIENNTKTVNEGLDSFMKLILKAGVAGVVVYLLVAISFRS
jgi:hypothetical protein